MNRAKAILVLLTITLATVFAKEDTVEGLENTNTSTEQTTEVSDQATVQVNKEMIKQYQAFLEEGSNTILTWDVIKDYSFTEMKNIVEDYNAIVKGDMRRY